MSRVKLRELIGRKCTLAIDMQTKVDRFEAGTVMRIDSVWRGRLTLRTLGRNPKCIRQVPRGMVNVEENN